MKTKELNIMERAAAPTPKFFKRLRNIGLILGTVGATIVAAPVALPVILVKIATYIAVAGGVLTAVSQTSVDEGAMEEQIVDRFELLKKLK